MAKLKPYTKYKDSNSNWLDSVPIDWNVQPLISIGRIKKVIGQTNRELLSVYLNKGVIRFTDVDEKRTNVTSKDLSKYQSVDEGDFVLNNQQAWRGSVGVSSYKGIVSPAYLIIKLDSILDPEFANYMFRDKSLVSQFLIYSKGVGSIQRNLYWNDLKRVDLYIPPKDTQKAIANYLNTKSKEIDKYVKKLKKEIALLKEHRQKIISQAVTCGLDENGKLRKKPKWNEGDPIPKGWQDSGVEWLGLIPEGWEVLPLKALTDYITRGNTPNYVEEGIPVVNQATFSKGYFDKQSLRFDSNRDTSRRGILKYGDILIASTGGGVLGKSYYFDEKDLYLADSHVTIIRSNRNKFHSKFVYYFFSINFDLINGILARGATNQTELQKQWLKNISLPIPPLVMQNKISNYLDEQMEYIQIELDKINEQIEFIKEYKQSLISKVVTGKIDVRNINNNLSED